MSNPGKNNNPACMQISLVQEKYGARQKAGEVNVHLHLYLSDDLKVLLKHNCDMHMAAGCIIAIYHTEKPE